MSEVRIPKVGDDVIYVMPNGQERTAKVVANYHNDTSPNLHVFTDFGNDANVANRDAGHWNSWTTTSVGEGRLWMTSVTYDQDTKAPGTWHWPEP